MTERTRVLASLLIAVTTSDHRRGPANDCNQRCSGSDWRGVCLDLLNACRRELPQLFHEQHDDLAIGAAQLRMRQYGLADVASDVNSAIRSGPRLGPVLAGPPPVDTLGFDVPADNVRVAGRGGATIVRPSRTIPSPRSAVFGRVPTRRVLSRHARTLSADRPTSESAHA